jgi:hypothetical protein
MKSTAFRSISAAAPAFAAQMEAAMATTSFHVIVRISLPAKKAAFP